MALRVLERVERSGAYADLLLNAQLGRSNLAAGDRAFAPVPGARASLDGEILRILAAEVVPEPCERPPGSIARSRDELRIATGHAWLRPLVLQRPGKRALNIAAFLRGRPLADGARFELPA